MIKALVSNIFQIKGDFQKLFFFKEHEELSGTNSSKILTLIAILSFTLLALGFAIGGTKYLEKKMSDPFTNWVDLNVKGNNQKYIAPLFKDFSDEELRDSFKLKNIKEYNRERKAFIHRDRVSTSKMMRTYQPDSDLIKEILSDKKKNVIYGLSYNGNDEEFYQEYDKCGLILKEDALLNMGYTDFSKVNYISLKDLDDIFYFPLIAVVKEIPNDAQVLISSHLYNLIFSDFEESGFVNVSATNHFEILHKQESDESTIEEKVRSFYVNEGNVIFDHKKIELYQGEESTISTVYFERQYERLILDSLYSAYAEGKDNVERYVEYECNLGDRNSISNPYYLSFNFNRLDSVRSFKNYLSDKYEIEISMSQVESKENFALVSRLTALLSTILFGFSLLSIVFYINSLLSSHLEKIKMNLGTFKAFGLDNKLLISTYMKIISYYIIKAVVISFILCALFEIGENFISSKRYFDIFNIKILIAILIIVIITLLTSRKTISKYLLKTPGDLIYNR